MAPKVPLQALETARNKLKIFRSRSSNYEWKAFEIVNADEESMRSYALPYKFETQLLNTMESRTRLPCVVCQSDQGVTYCSITFTSKLSQKERIAHSRFRPPFYCVLYPNENVFYSTRQVIPDVIEEALIELFKGTKVRKMPLAGKDFRSLRQLHYNRLHKGLLSRRPVPEDIPLGYDKNNELSPDNDEDDVIQDEDELWKKGKQKYYQKHFYPESDPTITKFTISSSSPFRGTRASRQLNCDLKVTFRTENLLTFFDYSMDKGILNYPLNPYLEGVVNLGRTSISLNPQK